LLWLTLVLIVWLFSSAGHDCLYMCVCVCVCVKVVDIMRVNVDKVLERDQKLSELDNRAGM